MFKKRIVFFGFDIYEAAALETYLENQAKKGWVPDCFQNFLILKRCEPENLKFHVEPFYSASFDQINVPEPVRRPSEVPHWTRCCRTNVFDIYCAQTALPPEKGFLDESSRFNAASRHIFRRYLPAQLLVSLFLVFLIWISNTAYVPPSISRLSGGMFLMLLVFLIFMLYPLAWYVCGRRALRRGLPVPAIPLRIKQIKDAVVCFLLAICLLWLMLLENAWLVLLKIIRIFGFLEICRFIYCTLREEPCLLRTEKKTAYVVSVIILAIIYLPFTDWLISLIPS